MKGKYYIMENESFEELYNESIKNDRKLNKIETGKVIKITNKGEIFVDLGYKADGIIPKKEYSDDENANPNDEFKTGDDITVEVLKLNDGVGNVLLSYKKMRIKNAREIFAKKVALGETFDGIIKSINEKGIVTNVYETRVFIPLSLSGIYRNEDLQSYVGKKITFEIIEFEPDNNKIVGSHKIIEDRKKQKAEDELWSSISEGKEYIGTVKSISNYGVFIDLNGVHGLLHISEITWKRNANPNDYFKVGQEVNVFVKSIDRENKKIQLGYSRKEVSPWENILDKYHEGDMVKGKVIKFAKFGAFVELEEGIEGLVHISEISEERVLKPEDELQLGEIVDAKILEIDLEKRNLKLSIKAAHADDWKKDVLNIEGVSIEE